RSIGQQACQRQSGANLRPADGRPDRFRDVVGTSLQFWFRARSLGSTQRAGATMDLSFSPDSPAWVCYLIVLLFGVLTGWREVVAQLKDTYTLWRYPSAW